jgi:hypothetical protein
MPEMEASLQRLNTDYIDLYQIHGFDPVTPLEETLSALTDLGRHGKVRYIGCSNLSAWQIMKSFGISATRHLEKFVTLQAYYSLAGRELEREVVPMLRGPEDGAAGMESAGGRFPVGQVHARRARRRFGAAQQVHVSARGFGEGLRHGGGDTGDRAASERHCRTGGPGLATSSAGRDQRDCRRKKRKTVEGQPGLGGIKARRARVGPTGQGQPTGAGVSGLDASRTRIRPAAGTGQGLVEIHEGEEVAARRPLTS